MRNWPVFLAGLSAILVLALLTSCARSKDCEPPSSGSLKIEVAYGDARFLVNPDGSGRCRLRGIPSPDGRRVFQAAEDGTMFVSDLDGSHKTPVLGDGFTSLEWSPTSEYFALVAGSKTGQLELFIVRADGLDVVRPTGSGPKATPPISWSADGSKLAFRSGSPPRQELYVVNRDGSGLTRVAEDVFGGETWSPDSKRILLQTVSSLPRDRSLQDTGYDVMIVDADGTHMRRLNDKPLRDPRPIWSPEGRRILLGESIIDVNQPSRVQTFQGYGATWAPDGKRIAFLRSERSSQRIDVYARSLEDGMEVLLTRDFNIRIGTQTLIWSPDGRYLALNDGEIYLIKADGSGVVNLTNNTAADGPFSWSPDGRYIAFYSDRDRIARGFEGHERIMPQLFVIDVDNKNTTRVTKSDDFWARVDGPKWFVAMR